MQPLARAELSLTGLSIGDAFGQMFFGNTETMSMAIDLRALPAPPWYLTDDSIMAIGIVETLRDRGEIDRDYLASRFAAGIPPDWQQARESLTEWESATVDWD